MVGATQAELDTHLRVLHLALGFLLGRANEILCQPQPTLTHPDRNADRPDGWWDRIQDDRPLDVVVAHWKEIDIRLGLQVPEHPAPLFP